MNSETATFRAWLAATVLCAVWLCYSGIARAQYYDPNCPDGRCPLQQAPPSDGWRFGDPILRPAEPTAPTVQPSQAITQAVVRVANRVGGGRMNLGSGTLVEVADGSGLVLSCNHLFNVGSGVVEVYFQDGKVYQATLLETDPYNDLSAFEIAAPPQVAPVTLATAEPAGQEACVSGGYGSEGRVLFRRGPFFGWERSETGAQQLMLRSSTRSGDSGGPVFNARWELCGVVIATNREGPSRTVLCASCTPIKTFLAKARASWAQRRAARRNPAQPLPGPAPIQPPLVDVTPPIAIQPTAPAAPDNSIVDKLKADLEAANKVIKDKADALAKLQPPSSASGGEAPKWDGSNSGHPPDITTPNLKDKLEHGAEGLATKAGTAWLTPILVGLGIPAGPAGLAASAVASAAIGFIGWKAKGWWANRKGGLQNIQLPLPLPHIQLPPLPTFPPIAPTQSQDQGGAAVTATAPATSTPNPLEPIIADLRNKLAAAQQPVIYRAPPIGDNLPRMRQAMKLASDDRPECFQWVKHFEAIYNQLLGGESNA